MIDFQSTALAAQTELGRACQSPDRRSPSGCCNSRVPTHRDALAKRFSPPLCPSRSSRDNRPVRFLLWPMTRQPTNPRPKSTPAYPKSTVDLGCELLIWGKNTAQTGLLLGLQYSFCSIITRPIAKSNQNQTETDQKINHLAALQRVQPGGCDCLRVLPAFASHCQLPPCRTEALYNHHT
jgi:hypothetical protein